MPYFLTGAIPHRFVIGEATSIKITGSGLLEVASIESLDLRAGLQHWKARPTDIAKEDGWIYCTVTFPSQGHASKDVLETGDLSITVTSATGAMQEHRLVVNVEIVIP